MKRVLILFFISLFSYNHIISKPISPEESLKRFENNSNNSTIRKIANTSKFDFIKELKLKNGDPALYIFNKDKNDGFIILSADDRLISLVGYTDQGNFSDSIIPSSLSLWLEEYVNQIEYLKENDLLNHSSYFSLPKNPGWEAIEPIVTTKWNQNEPYNRKCPEINDKKCVTGCLATAMAQVINYFQYPSKGCGSISYIPNNNFSEELTLDLENELFDYNNMLDQYETGNYSDIEADAVATLMRACGFSLYMNYGIWESYAYYSNFISAFINNFRYDNNIKQLYRANYSYDEWIKMIYDNLKNIGPVIYNGNPGFAGGHSFVCDGYDGNGYFHINWGWGGYCDGYFIVDFLNPYDVGIGGGNGYYNAQQNAIFNIQPPTESYYEDTEVLLSYSLIGSVRDGKLKLNTLYPNSNSEESISGHYQGDIEKEFRLGFIIEEIDNESSPLYYQFENMPRFFENRKEWDYYEYINLQDIPLNDKIRYRLTLAYLKDNNWEPVKAKHRYWNHFYMTKNGLEYTIENKDIASFNIKRFDISHNLYRDRNIQYDVTVENNTEQQITQSIGFEIRDDDGKGIYISYQYSILTLEPGESRDVHYETVWGWWLPYNENEQIYPKHLNLVPYDYQLSYEYDYHSIPVTIYKTTPVVNGVLKIPEYISDEDLIILEETNNINYEFDIEVIEGVFDEPIKISLFSDDLSLLHEEQIKLSTLYQGDTFNYKSNLQYNDFKTNNTYFLTASWDNNEISRMAFKVVELPKSIELSAHEIIINKGEIRPITYEIIPVEAFDGITWSTSNENVATVDNNGIINAIDHGETIITAAATNGVSDECKVIVIIPITAIELNKYEATINNGTTLELITTITPDDATDKTLLWSSSDESVATVDSEGYVSTVSVGEADITATATDGSGVSATCHVTVLPVLVEAIILTPDNWSGEEGMTCQIEASVLPDNATDKKLRWISSDKAVAIVNEDGFVAVLMEGNCVITATATDGSGIYAECMITSSAGIDEIFTDGETSWNVYDINGALLKKNCVKDGLKLLSSGIYILQSGNKIIKIVIR